jgi:hypothetical protein
LSGTQSGLPLSSQKVSMDNDGLRSHPVPVDHRVSNELPHTNEYVILHSRK